jgi:hypothetical protein
MKRTMKLANAVLLVLLAGCSVEGKWTLTEVDPTAARRDFEYESLTLQEDGTFYAESRGPTGIETSSGTYTHENGTLNLESHDGERHTYNTRFLTERHLRLQGFWNGQKVYAKFERQTKSVKG